MKIKNSFLSLIGVIILLSSNLFGQKPDTNLVKRSFEVYALYPNYFIKQSEFNYGFGGAFTAQIKRAKYSLGFNYSTKNYIELWYYYNSYYLYKTNHNTNYYNIPFSITFPLFNKDFKKKNDLIIGAGLIWNIPERYEAVTTFNHTFPNITLPSPSHYKVPKFELGVGHSFQLLFRYQRRINKTFDFYISGICCYKFSLEYENTPSMMSSWIPDFSEDRLFFGINAGFELYLKR